MAGWEQYSQQAQSHHGLNDTTLTSRGGFMKHLGLDTDAVEMLTRNLVLDALDCGVHVRLVQFWRRNGNLKRSNSHFKIMPDRQRCG